MKLDIQENYTKNIITVICYMFSFSFFSTGLHKELNSLFLNEMESIHERFLAFAVFP